MAAETGWDVLGTIGLRWSSGWRVELEGDYRENSFRVNTSNGTVSGVSAMLNGLYDFSSNIGFHPYLGLGVGALFSDYDAASTFPGGSQTDMAIQGLAGVTFPFADRWEGFADYRYFTTIDKIDHTEDPYRAHEIKVGLRWSFWEAPKPVAAPAPAPVAQPKDYVIYFEFDKANVTKAAGAVLDELKATSGGSSVSVVGHTDTSGSSAYNESLSERRAKNTAGALEKRGVKVDSVSGRGETDPAVQTGDGVKEPLNRRAVIKLNSSAPSQ